MTDQSRLAAFLPSVGRTLDPAHDLVAGLRDGNPTLTCCTCRRT